jgi:transcriptional regulator with XRE-family HTH domain
MWRLLHACVRYEHTNRQEHTVSQPPERRRPSWFRSGHWDPPAVGRAIAQRREELGLSRKEVAHLSELSYPYLSELENGTKQGSPTALSAVAEALGLAYHELLARAEAGTGLDRTRTPSTSVAREAKGGADGTLTRLAALRTRIREALADATPAEAEAALLMSLGEQRVRASGDYPAPPEPPHSSP